MKGQKLKERGIQQAEANANKHSNGWSQQAGETLCAFIKRRKKSFRTEEFREFAVKQGLPQPAHLRAFGGIINRAAKSGLIRHIGYDQVRNPKAHMANCSIWSVVR